MAVAENELRLFLDFEEDTRLMWSLIDFRVDSGGVARVMWRPGSC